MYRKVHLVVKEPVSIARHGVFVSTPEITGRQASVKVQVEFNAKVKVKIWVKVQVKVQ